MAIFTVTTTADTMDPNDGQLSLREAIEQANATAGADD
jgi:CSLREA domain-containing protein